MNSPPEGRRVARLVLPMDRVVNFLCYLGLGPTQAEMSGMPSRATPVASRLNPHTGHWEILIESPELAPYSGPPGAEPVVEWAFHAHRLTILRIAPCAVGPEMQN